MLKDVSSFISKDARNYQILALFLFLVLGIGTRDWTLKPELIGVIFATCLTTQVLMTWIVSSTNSTSLTNVKPQFSSAVKSGICPEIFKGWRSAVITSLGLCLLLRSDHYLIMVLAGFCAIASKFIFRLGDKHWFNPANFGIIAALLFTSDAWVSPGQWGDEVWYALVFIGAGGMVLKRVGRWDTSATFFLSYAGLELVRNLYLGWSWDVLGHRLMSGSLLLFAMFMITDPRSIPNARNARLIWAVAIAFLTFILRNYFFMSEAVFIALFALSPLTLFLDYLYKAPRFSWFKDNPAIPVKA
jgi:Na+-transporting NADH:ubiquinone oxidoreductase subunit NqrB